MQTYARQGGSSAIFVCDDGLQLLDDDDREERISFYANHSIGWVARPAQSSAPDGYKRAGRFKKASKCVVDNGPSFALFANQHFDYLVSITV